MTPLTTQDYQKAAKRLNCEIAAIMAFAKVEAPRGAYNPDGSLTALFEPHVFYGELKKKGFDVVTLTKQNPKIISPVWNKKLYPKTQAGVYLQIKAAVDLCEKLGIQNKHELPNRSCSWGKFQVLGRNFEDLGFESAEKLFFFLKESEANQLEVFCRFIEANIFLKRALQLKKWAGVALLYNGKGYKLNQYHIKLAEAYDFYKKSLPK